MASYEKCVEYRNVIMGSCPVQVGPVSEWYTVQMIVPNVRRLTRERQIELGKELWKFSGRAGSTYDAADEEVRFRWAQSHMGRYKYVEVFDEDDYHYSYRSDSSLGGNYPKSQLLIVNN